MPFKDLDRIRAVKKRVQGRLLAIPGVHAVGIGSKMVAGNRTDEPAIMVFVVKKRPPSELSREHLIPPEVEGIKTDVYESDVFRHMAEDEEKYRTNPALMAGCKLMMGGATGQLTIHHPPDPDRVYPAEGLGGIGTLGCFAKTGGTNPKALAITCWHVLASANKADPTQLALTQISGGFTVGGTNTPGTLIVLSMGVSTGDNNVYYLTGSSDTLATIASALADRVNALGTAGLNATVAGTQVTIVVSGTGTLSFEAYGPHAKNTWASIHATVSGTAISVTGEAKDPCAAFVVLNTSGTQPTHGIFVPIAEGDNASKVATAIATAISARSLTGITAIEMDPPNPGDPAIVNISGVQTVHCDVSNDLRVGQPTNSFCSRCSKCCDDRIGTLIDAQLDVDAALVQLNPDYVEKYRAEVLEIGVIRGVHDIHAETSGYPLQKRGEATFRTHGTLLAIDTDGNTSTDDSNNPPTWHLYGRHYTGAFTIKPNSGQFADHGDSGSAVLTDNAPNSNQEIVGILFGSSPTAGVATPIQQILAAFPALNLSIETASTPGVDKTVPAAAPAHTAKTEVGNNRIAAEPILGKLSKIEQEVAATNAGRRYNELIQKHFPEAQRLINNNRRVAAAWRRHGGPQIVRSIVKMADTPDQGVPAEVDGRPFPECLAGIQAAFARYASPEFAADLAQYGPNIAQLAGRNYSQALDVLRNMQMD